VLRVALVDLGMGNLRSVERALLYAAGESGVPCDIDRTSDPDRVRQAHKIVVPGQGAFRDCSATLTSGLGEALRERIAAGTPFLGICLGLQALFDGSDEAPGAPGLGVFRGRSVRLNSLAVDPATGQPVKIPHMGWNELVMARSDVGPLRTFLAAPPHVYFVHSYHAEPADASLIAAITQHGPYRVTAAIQRDNVTATQFHPEKSQRAGIRLLTAFLGD
jgi:glutamine amidotransferase